MGEPALESVGEGTLLAGKYLLEKRLGAQLLDRSGRDVTPTDAGEVLYRHARQIIDLDDEARVEILNLDELGGGRVTIGASTGPGEHLLPELITEFNHRTGLVG